MCVSVCLCPCVCWFISPVKSVWGVWGIIGTWIGKGMLYFEFHAPLHIISDNFGHFSHFFANLNMMDIKMHVFELRNSMVTLSNTFKHFFMQFNTIFMQFHTILAILAILGQFQHVGYQNACTQAEKFIGNTFKKFHMRVHAISRNFQTMWAISAIFGPISTCWVSKCMYSSWEIHW